MVFDFVILLYNEDIFLAGLYTLTFLKNESYCLLGESQGSNQNVNCNINSAVNMLCMYDLQVPAVSYWIASTD